MIDFIKDIGSGLKHLKSHVEEFKDLTTGIKLECKNVQRNVRINGIALDQLKPSVKN